MRKNFDFCLETVLKLEGGFVDNPRDPGGATNWGLTRYTISAFEHEPVSVYAVRNFPREKAGEIYRALYWDAVDGDHLPDGEDLMLFDIAVNSGVGRAEAFDKVVDKLPDGTRIDALNRMRLSFWKRLATWSYFGRGWTNRERMLSRPGWSGPR